MASAVTQALLGVDNVCYELLSEMYSGNGDRSRANLTGKFLNTCSDVSQNALSDNFKCIDTGKPISKRQLYKDVATLIDYPRIIFCLNELPKTKDQFNGYFRRFLIDPFNVQISKAKVDPKLVKRIAAQNYRVLWSGY